MDNFVKTIRRQVIPVDQQLDNILQQQIAKNREILSSLFKSVIFCGRNNIALRCHRDDNPRNTAIQGNFHALLAFPVDSGDKILEEHLLNSPRNATYVSKTIQNEMITTVGKYILDNLLHEIIIFAILQILATIPMSSASCERCELFKKLSEDRLNGLALMYAYREIELDLDHIIDLFANLHPRRMRMSNILED